jgi:hypothetical protein
VVKPCVLHTPLPHPCLFTVAEVLCLYEDEVVLLQDRLLQGGLAKGLPGITYELADLQVGGAGVAVLERPSPGHQRWQQRRQRPTRGLVHASNTAAVTA